MKILSLNIRKWSRDLNPFDWNHWWVVRTWRQRKFFKEEKPDIICLQERCWPIGKLLLGLWEYKCYGGWKCPTPIYIKKEYKYVLRSQFLDMGNNHGYITALVQNKLIVNVHFSYDRIPPLAVSHRVIVCGDFNCKFAKIKESFRQDIMSVREATGFTETDTFQNYKYPEQHGEIDHFIVSTFCKLDCTMIQIGSNYKQYALSDHEPLIIETKDEKEKS